MMMKSGVISQVRLERWHNEKELLVHFEGVQSRIRMKKKTFTLKEHFHIAEGFIDGERS